MAPRQAIQAGGKAASINAKSALQGVQPTAKRTLAFPRISVYLVLWSVSLAEKMKISLEGGKTFEIELEPGAALRESLGEEFTLQKHTCGGHGRCGSCIALIESGLEDLQPPSEAESRILRILKADPSQRLMCQARGKE